MLRETLTSSGERLLHFRGQQRHRQPTPLLTGRGSSPGSGARSTAVSLVSVVIIGPLYLKTVIVTLCFSFNWWLEISISKWENNQSHPISAPWFPECFDQMGLMSCYPVFLLRWAAVQRFSTWVSWPLWKTSISRNIYSTICNSSKMTVMM